MAGKSKVLLLPPKVVVEIRLKQHICGCGCYTTWFEGNERVGGCCYLGIGSCCWLGWVYCNDDAVHFNLDGGPSPEWSLWGEALRRGARTVRVLSAPSDWRNIWMIIFCCRGQQWTLGSILCEAVGGLSNPLHQFVYDMTVAYYASFPFRNDDAVE
jgi:hypothetical protein